MLGWLSILLLLAAASAVLFGFSSVVAQYLCSRTARWPQLRERYACSAIPEPGSRHYSAQSAQFHDCTFKRALDIYVSDEHIQFQLGRWQPHWLIKPIRIPIRDFREVIRHRGPLGVPVICALVGDIEFSCSGHTIHRLAMDPIWAKAGIRDAESPHSS